MLTISNYNTLGSHRVNGGGGGSYLLDDYGDDIGGAYSFRLLSSTYSGDCIRVRRSSDNTEADIGFSAGYLDEAALLAHVGTGGSDNGYMVEFYDQSGAFVGTPSALNDGDLTAASTTYQPLVVNAGVILKGGGFVKAGSVGRINMANPAAAGSGNGWITGYGNKQDIAIFSVAYPTDANHYDAWLGSASYGGKERGCIGITNSVAPRYLTLRTQDGTSYTQITGTTAITYDTFHLGTGILKAAPATTYLALDGLEQESVTNWVNISFHNLAWPGAAFGTAPDAAEFLIYQNPPDASTTAAIEANIMDYYLIS